LCGEAFHFLRAQGVSINNTISLWRDQNMAYHQKSASGSERLLYGCASAAWSCRKKRDASGHETGVFSICLYSKT